MITTINEFKQNIITESKENDQKKVALMKAKLEELGLNIASVELEYETLGRVEFPDVTFYISNFDDATMNDIVKEFELYVKKDMECFDARIELYPEENGNIPLSIDIF